MIRRALALSLATLLIAGIAAQSETPELLGYQGRLTDNIGSPVADGSYSVVFTIYDAVAAGTSVWTESQNVTTTNGLFSVTLGAVNPVPDTVFNMPVRYLGMAVDGDPELSPRTELVSVPYAQRISTIDGSSGGEVAGDVVITTTSNGNALEVSQLGLGRGGFFQVANGGNTEAAVQGTHVGAGPGGSFFSDGGGPGLTTSATGGVAAELYGSLHSFGDMVGFDGVDSAMRVDVTDKMIRTFGSDGLEQIRLWGSSYGELRLNDNTDNDLTATLSATSNSGGKLQLMDETGAIQITLAGGSSGDASAVLPQDAINKSEILDEPGLAHSKWETSFSLDASTPDTLIFRTITVPTNGYVVAMLSSDVYLAHQENFTTWAYLKIVPPGEVYGNGTETYVSIPGLAADGAYYMSAAVTGLYSVNAGANVFTVQGTGGADLDLGGAATYRTRLVLLFVPTLYGTVSPNNVPAVADIPVTAEEEAAEARQFNEQRIQGELLEVKNQLKALQEQFEQMANSDSGY